MLILGIDPGTAKIGLGLIEYKNKKTWVKCYDCLTTNAADTTAARLNDLYKQLLKFIKEHQPDIIAVEELFFFKNLKTAIKVSQARGVILLAAAQQGLKIYEYTPLQVKQALTGYGRAEKKQMQQMVKVVLNLKEVPRPDDAADALAVAVCCAHSLR
ncbi:MAG: Crossover junction endodeoxyribonuclease RuvC [Parcubacteria group bacterium GW2011_GWA2_43_9b]|uniref:Crossover junction endodeoxyribonuclease RuvC n=2 Tax=Parcubacteria group TaxID=1794811 RepID=A0A1G2FUL2_9BACT|nr:MAG: Crossover junction endodeoxyribonuclease RuvC [Parcubacteria group bacterium GW2011_GWA2_43_9b]OGY91069.1 MAG: crossover junction endodeoxyribonuclease RuvC [Candidatus Komeilibacteria bacterium RIFCSPLOWO2_02_FULL_48_11]OGZ41271.1 MAG: crossover junction endodeoxyribonuclease RuvC [Candidatus Portnoybacteria bacterium RIFCSPLOWO2_02_FULL_39_11]